jgi:hypothetical protein
MLFLREEFGLRNFEGIEIILSTLSGGHGLRYSGNSSRVSDADYRNRWNSARQPLREAHRLRWV